MVDLSRFRRRHQQQLRYYDKPARERHFLSLVASVLSIIMLILALSLPEWAKGRVSQCDFVFGLTQVRYQDSNAHTQNVESMTQYYVTSQQILISCILSVTALTLLSSIVGTIISAGYPREKLEFLRHYSVFNIVSLLCIVLVAGLWLAVTETLPTSRVPECVEDPHTEINFGYAYYILLVGGLFSLGAASFNLLFARSAAERRRMHRLRFREQQNVRARQLTNRAPPAYSLLASTDFSESETEAETSMSEPEDLAEPNTPPPAYSP